MLALCSGMACLGGNLAKKNCYRSISCSLSYVEIFASLLCGQTPVLAKQNHVQPPNIKIELRLLDVH